MLLAVILVSFAALLSQAFSFPPSQHVYFNLATEPYELLYQRLHDLLVVSSEPPYSPTNVHQRYVLGPRRDDFKDLPLGWIQVHLTGDTPEDRATLALADDDLYILGFANATGRWHVVKQFCSGLPGAIPLPFEESYRQLIGGEGHRDLWRYPLGKQSALAAVRTLARYDPSTIPDDQVKDAFVRLAVMVSEALRFKPIRDVFSGTNWEQQTSLSKTQSKFVVNWGKLSVLLINWQRTGTWGGSENLDRKARNLDSSIKVRNPTQALNKVDFLIRPKPNEF